MKQTWFGHGHQLDDALGLGRIGLQAFTLGLMSASYEDFPTGSQTTPAISALGRQPLD